MPMGIPSRDRLPRPIDISALLPSPARRVGLIVDEPGLRWAGLSGNKPTHNGSGGNGSSGRRVGVYYRTGYGRGIRRSPVIGRENRAPAMAARRRVGSRGRGSVLPSWYPRTPLRDITAVVRAIERRAELRDAQRTEEAPQPQEETNAPSVSTAQLEHEIEASTPLPTIATKPQPSPAILNQKGSDSDFVTPQKRLLNSIDKVREIWLEEQRKLEKTPAAKKAEREQKVRTLMSMR